MKDNYDPEAWKHWPRASQGLCETTLTERYEFSECVCGTYPDNLGPCRTYEVGANKKRCVYCDHKLQCHTAIEPRFYVEFVHFPVRDAEVSLYSLLRNYSDIIRRAMGIPNT